MKKKKLVSSKITYTNAENTAEENPKKAITLIQLQKSQPEPPSPFIIQHQNQAVKNSASEKMSIVSENRPVKKFKSKNAAEKSPNNYSWSENKGGLISKNVFTFLLSILKKCAK